MRRLIGALSVAAVLVGVLAGPAGAAAPARVWATIHGGGTANMEDGAGSSVFGLGVRLWSDGSASGQFDCLDQHGDAPGYPGNIWGKVTGWSRDGDGNIVLHVVGKLVAIPGGLVARDLPFDVTIQQFGGAGVGRWTLTGPFGPNGEMVTVCFEILTSGQIVMRLA